MDSAHPQAKKALFLLTLVNYLNYIDRFILSAVLMAIKVELQLSDFQAGLLATAFMVAYMFTSPIFGWLGDTRNRSRILAGGVFLWSCASLLTGWAGTFITIALSRFLLGFGESAFTTIATPYISDFFPSSKRGKALAVFSSGLPVGAALGFVLGGLIAQWLGWREAFWIAGFPGLILAILIFKMPDPNRRETLSNFNYRKIILELSKIGPYVWTTIGYCAYSFVVGGIAHWIPTYLQRAYELDQMKANVVFGGIAVGSGLCGTLLGGAIGDRWARRMGTGGHLKISSISMALALPCFIACLYSPSFSWMVFFLTLTQFFFFVSTSPISVSIIESVPKYAQTSAMSITIFLCHILGDAISSPLIGLVSDQTGSLRNGLAICIPVIAISSLAWKVGMNKKLVKI